MAINILQGMAAFFGEPEAPALPFNCLVQLRIPGLDSEGKPNGPDFTPRRITKLSDVVTQYNPGFKIELVDPDGNRVPHLLAYQNQNTPNEFFNKQFNPRYLVQNLQKACDGAETRSLLWEDIVRSAALLRAITHWAAIQDDVNRWLGKIPDDATNFENELNKIWDEKPVLPPFEYSIYKKEEVLFLPNPNDCTQSQIDTLQRDREARLKRNRFNEDQTSLDLKEEISYRPWANTLAENILRQSMLGFLQNKPKSQHTPNNLLDHLRQINQSINKRFVENFRTAIAAQQSIERPLREIAGLFSEFEETVDKERERCEQISHYMVPTANIFLVNAHMLDAPNGEGVIIDNNVLLGNHDKLSTVKFCDVMRVSQHIALMVVSDRMRGTAGDVMALAPKAKDISMIVVANIDSDALAFNDQAVRPEALGKKLKEDFGGGEESSLTRIALFGSDVIIRKEEQLGDFTIPQLAIRPAILAAGKLLALGLATEPVAADPITNVEGIPKILSNRATIIENIPVNVVCEIDSSLLRPLYHLSGCKSAYAMDNHPSIIYTAIADTIARLVRQYLIMKVRTPADEAEVKKNAKNLNQRLVKLINRSGVNSLVTTAQIDVTKCKLITSGTKVTQYLPLTITLRGVTTDFEIDFQAQLA